VSRPRQLRRKASDFERRAATAETEEERVQLLTVAQACKDLADEKDQKRLAR
jgi:hypothetical protein